MSQPMHTGRGAAAWKKIRPVLGHYSRPFRRLVRSAVERRLPQERTCDRSPQALPPAVGRGRNPVSGIPGHPAEAGRGPAPPYCAPGRTRGRPGGNARHGCAPERNGEFLLHLRKLLPGQSRRCRGAPALLSEAFARGGVGHRGNADPRPGLRPRGVARTVARTACAAGASR